ncbi:DUF3826 domain-containing protein [Dysgonomonas sp. 520]|uniref:DUF3826 domain-containing protein n=1 Tax=Dysgonomonas sp. 520 TaxID=2302931 RepID=UPI0013D12D31|nr:DUF3826 domain-containing protein [Dysgonomonas sp. 520]NDW09680.1 DUF3826 domain-containing protein [Dysgonomonas sp. 520]
MKVIFSFLAINFLFLSSLFAQDDADYIKVLTGRADKIVKTLGIEDSEKYKRVTTALVNQYKGLGEANDALESEKKVTKESIKDKAELENAIKALENKRDAELYNLQCIFIGSLSADLTNEQIDMVKDGMTYGVLKVTYESYQDMIPTLKEDEKRQIYAWLVEAREHAMSASSSKDKHGWFGKYKGRINNYLSKQGYNLQKEREAWGERVKARGGTL